MPSLILDVVNQDPFKQISMTDAINKIEFVPNQLGAMGIFTLAPIRTAMVTLDVRSSTIRLVPTTQRGEPIESRDKRRKAQFKYFSTDRIAIKDRINATDLAFLREFGTADQPKELSTEIALRQNGDGNGLMGDIDLTKEFQRLGAIRGKLYDTEGTLLYDYFSEMGVNEPSVLTIGFTTLLGGKLRTYIVNNVKRYMEKNSKGAKYSKIIALCGSDAYDKLHENGEFREAHLAQIAAQELLRDHTETPTHFAGVDWVEYKGTDDNVILALDDDQIIFIPAGMNNTVYKQVVSPGEKFSHIGQLGKEFYSWMKWDQDEDPEWVDIYVAAYLLMLNTRPEMTRIAKAT
ncbi:MAG: major capsid protein [Alteromonadaceae bacterium]|nr:major capsid protein [Alteromonadaceae bacterium]